MKGKDFDIIGRIKRTVLCQKRNVYRWLWSKMNPNTFYKHPRLVTAIWYASCEGKWPNFKHPSNFNERLMAINLDTYYDQSQWPIRVIGADKYAVREYVEQKGLGHILNEIYGVYDSIDEIDWNELPNQFVIKTTHGSGKNYICRDKSEFDVEAFKQLAKDWMKKNDFGLTTGEWHYNLIQPRIIIEKFLYTPGEDVSLIDYKFHCIHGHVYGEYVCYDRDYQNGAHTVNYDHYDADWNLTDGVKPYFHPHQRPIPKPKHFEQMKKIAETLSEGINYVRVDLYEVGDKVIFGEMTFTPMGNYLPYTQERLEDMENYYRATM